MSPAKSTAGWNVEWTECPRQTACIRYLLLHWAHCCRPRYDSLTQDAACWNLRCGPEESGLSKTENQPCLHLPPNMKGVGAKGHCNNSRIISITFVTIIKCYITPQKWILLHVIRNNFAGIHVTEEQFTSFLCTIRTNWNHCVFCMNLFSSDKPLGHCALARAQLFYRDTNRLRNWTWTD